MQSMPITSEVLISNLAHGEVYSIHHYEVKKIQWLATCRWFSPPIKLTATINWYIVEKDKYVVVPADRKAPKSYYIDSLIKELTIHLVNINITVDIKVSAAHDTFLEYLSGDTQNQIIWKTKESKMFAFGSNKIKGSKRGRQNQIKSPMPEGGEP